jgi:uncharacterized protein (DUF2235 family)
MSKTLALFCDGTWNTADQTTKDGRRCSTNVIKLIVRMKTHANDGTLQIGYYDQGVGSGNWFDRITGGAFGDGLEANVHDAYRFLLANYEPGDKIYLLGFSRGAYTARSIGGMVRRCGVLQRKHIREYAKATKIYRTLSSENPEAQKFRADFAIESDTPIHCVAVWDTVGSLGIPLRGFRSLTHRKYRFLDTSLNPFIKYGFHALAVDEHRGPFEPALWTTKPEGHQTVKQVWFAGAHSDVGGGYGENEEGLSDLAMEWMMDTVEKEAGLEFDPIVRDALSSSASYKGEVHNSKTGLYKLTMGINRKIGATEHGTEYFHRSLIEKWHYEPAYRPKSLRRHAARLKTIAASPLTDEIYPV